MSMKLQTHKWKQIPLGQACSILSGYAWSSKRFNRSGEGIPIIRIQNVDSTSKEEFVYWNEDYEKRFVIKKGDVLLTLSGSFRVCTWSGPDALLNQRVVRLTPNQDIDRRWFLYLMQTLLQRIELMGKHALVNNVSLTDLRTIPIPLPPLPEQRRIAAILDKADAVRRKRQEAIRLTEQFLRSAFLEMFGDVPAKKSRYSFGTVRTYVSAHSGKSSKPVLSKDPTGIPVYGGNGINGWATKALYEEPVIVVGRVGQQCGITHFTSGPAWITDNAIIVRVVDRSRLHPVYLGTAFQHSPIRATVERLDLPFINQSMLLDYPIPLPQLCDQMKYVELRKTNLAHHSNQTKNLKEADNLFNALVQRAFHGEL